MYSKDEEEFAKIAEEEFDKIAEEVIRLVDGKMITTSWKLSIMLMGASLEAINVPRPEIEKFLKSMANEFVIVALQGNEKVAEEFRKRTEDFFKEEKGEV